MANSSQNRRAFTGPVFYSHGFRSFFLFASIWGALAMTLWVSYLAAGWEVPSRMAGVDWHMHEMVFGYTSAVIAGFLLTAVPNWTGRLPIIGWPTALLSGLWVLGRVAIFFSEFLPQFIAPVIDASFLFVLAGVIGREIIAGKNWRNLKVLLVIMALAGANVWFHIESLGGDAYQGRGIRLGVAILVVLITIIGGRVIPSFTRNWLVRQGKADLPKPRDRFDNQVESSSVLILGLWVFLPDNFILWAGLLVVSFLHMRRLWRWVSWKTFGEPMVAILHVGYFFVPLGFFMLAVAGPFPGIVDPTIIPHAWMVGAIGVMTLAMMTRASLGHSGRPIKSSWATTSIYALIIGATLLRIWAEFDPANAIFLHASATAWILGFGWFCVLYFPLFTRPKTTS